jgi:hypothetical protein
MRAALLMSLVTLSLAACAAMTPPKFRLSSDGTHTSRATAGSKRGPVRVRTVVHQRRSHNLGRVGRCPHGSGARGQQGALDSAAGNATGSLGATPRLTRAAREGRNSLLLSDGVPSQRSLLPDRGLLGDFGQRRHERADLRHSSGTGASSSVGPSVTMGHYHGTSTGRSNPHQLVQIRRRRAAIEEAEVAFVLHGGCCVEETGHRRAIE